jgi:cation-transporting P-type ATPase J
VDQASITGEPLPVVRGTGDPVFAGTVNGTGVLRVGVDRAAAETVVAHIVAQVERASATKATTQLFIERIERRYSVGVVAATLLLFGVPLAAGSELRPALLRAMTFMIVASPCAVVLATMPPLLAAIANAGPGSGCAEATLLRLAASAEYPAEHPLARAIVTAATEGGLALAATADFDSQPGRGVTATVEGQRVHVGRPDPSGEAHPWAARTAAEFEERGDTAVVVTIQGEPVGVLALADAVRPGASEAVGQLSLVTGTPPA